MESKVRSYGMNKKLSLFLIITALFASSIFSQKTVVLSRSNGNKVIDGVINWHNTGSPVNMDATWGWFNVCNS